MPHTEALSAPEALAPLTLILAKSFVQRWDMYPKQLPTGKYLAIHERLNPLHLTAHLQGEMTLGTYLLNAQAQGRFVVFDADDDDEWQQLQAMAADLSKQGLPSYLERSRRGGHSWLFLGGYRPALAIRQFAHGLLAAYELDVEVYPKQSALVTGPGSLIRLPFGIHQKTGKRYGFTAGSGQPLGRSAREQLTHFMKPLTISEAHFRQFQHAGQALASRSAPTRNQAVRESSMPLFMSADAPVSERLKAAISVRAFIDTYLPEVQLTEQGRGFCPFHEDQTRSFSISDERNFWRCFAEGCAGYSGATIIDLWMLWQHQQGRAVTFKEALKELADLVL